MLGIQTDFTTIPKGMHLWLMVSRCTIIPKQYKYQERFWSAEKQDPLLKTDQQFSSDVKADVGSRAWSATAYRASWTHATLRVYRTRPSRCAFRIGATRTDATAAHHRNTRSSARTCKDIPTRTHPASRASNMRYVSGLYPPGVRVNLEAPSNACHCSGGS